MILKNIIKVYTSWIGIIGTIIGFLCIAVPGFFIIDKSTIVLWYGEVYYFWTEIVLWWLVAVLFWIFLGSTLYKMKYFWGGKKKTFFWTLWGFLGLVAWGCPACSITFASYIGLASLVSLLPYRGLELKILSVVFLLYACYATLRDLEVCKLKVGKKKGENEKKM